MSNQCPLCGTALSEEPQSRFETKETVFRCPNCLEFAVSKPLSMDLGRRLAESPANGPLLSYLVRQMQRSGEPVRLTTTVVNELLASQPMPQPAEQADNLLLWLGDHSSAPGGYLDIWHDTHRAVMGAWNKDNFYYVLKELKERDLIKVDMTTGSCGAFLTFSGWERYRDLKKGATRSRHAFMAMPFGLAHIDRAFRECFQPAARVAGYHLARVDEDPPAGLIDDRIRVAIITSRFVVADLTEENRGVYWEAGFAEGLGRPVLYTCHAEWFAKRGTHFDTNHRHTIPWTEDNLPSVADAIKASIRATLPGEAVLEDD